MLGQFRYIETGIRLFFFHIKAKSQNIVLPEGYMNLLTVMMWWTSHTDNVD